MTCCGFKWHTLNSTIVKQICPKFKDNNLYEKISAKMESCKIDPWSPHPQTTIEAGFRVGPRTRPASATTSSFEVAPVARIFGRTSILKVIFVAPN
jgi:hypothetical protein